MKRIIAVFMALVVLMLPVASLAEGDFIAEALENGRMVERTTTFKLNEIGDENVDQIIGDLLDALSIITYQQKADGGQSGLRVNMSGKDILSVDVASIGEKLFLHSDLLANSTIVIAQGDEQALMDKLFDTLVEEGIIDESDAKNAKEQMSVALSGTSNTMSAEDVEAIFGNFDFSALQQLAVEFADRIEEADPSIIPEGIGATKAYTYTMTAEDVVKVYDLIFDAVKANKEYLALLDTMIVSVEGQQMSAEDAINEMQSIIRTQMPEVVKGDIPVSIYLNDEDVVVAAAMEMTMLATVNDGETPEEVSVKVNYMREAIEEQVMHQVVFAMGVGEDLLGAATLLYIEADGYVSAMLTILSDDETVSFAFEKTETATDTERAVDAWAAVSYGMNDDEASSASTVMLTVDIDAKKDGQDAEQTTKIDLSLNGTSLASMTTETKTGNPVESIATEDAIRLAEMSQEDFQSWFESVIMNLQVWLMTAIQSLPSSVLKLIMGSSAM